MDLYFFDLASIKTGERREESVNAQKKNKIHFGEASYRSFSRTFTFPNGVDAENVDAKYENGILSIALPKKAKAKYKKNSIK